MLLGPTELKKFGELFWNQTRVEAEKKFDNHNRESLNVLQQTVSRNLDFKDAASESISDFSNLRYQD